MVKIKTKYILILLYLTASSVFADSVILKNGNVITGVISGQTKTEIILRDEKGQTVRIAKSNIRRIAYGTEEKPEEKPRPKTEEQREIRQGGPDISVQQSSADQLYSRYAEEEKQILKETAEGQKDMKTQYRIRSAILPGWGQFSGGSNLRGAIYSGMFITAAAGGAYLYSESVNSRKAIRENRRSILIRDNILYPQISPILGAEGSLALFYYDYKQKETQRKNLSDYNAARNAFYGAGALTGAVYLIQILDVPVSKTIAASAVVMPDYSKDWKAAVILSARF